MSALSDVLAARRAQLASAPPEVRLLYASEVDRLYRLREGTAHALCAAGGIRCAKRSRAGRIAFLIAPDDAAKAWGPQ